MPPKGVREVTMSSITETAKAFFAACEAGKGWEVCKSYCTSYRFRIKVT